MKKLVIIPGGFHPFHLGHRALYDQAQQAFPSAEVYMAATNDVSDRPFPFRTKKFLAQQAGIPGNRFIEVKSPFSAEEITQHYDPETTQLIFVRSDKDRDQPPQPGRPDQTVTRGPRKGQAPYLLPYKRTGLLPMKNHAYMTYLPAQTFGAGMTSATEIRAKWPTMTSKEKARLVSVMYPLANDRPEKISKIISIIDTVMDAHALKEAQSAVDKLEQHRIEQLQDRMAELIQRAKKADPEMKASLQRQYDKIKAERDSYFQIRMPQPQHNDPLPTAQVSDYLDEK